MSKLTNPEEVLREVVWYGAHRYDDKPSQFWNRMRIAAEALGDAEAASTFDDYCENGCPLTREQEQAVRILAALREPSEAVVTAVCIAEDWQDFDAVYGIICAAVTAAEQEVGREYDNNGNITHYKNSTGLEVRREYDSSGNEIHTKNSNGYEVRREYDVNGNCIHFKNTNGYEAWYEFDNNGKCIHYKDSNGVEEHYE